ncbi:hypothetical protein V1512DRAFT_266129 [Lipomyces arxii]|uniref:uncharacterized protein n=1 Tax=Lipomyces arxii TaxID=56418 RepID=UPI0034CF5797
MAFFSCIADLYVSALKNNVQLTYLSLLFLSIGIIKYVGFGLSLTKLFLDIFVLPGTSMKKYGAGKGAWAIITGASDGIGKEFSIQLAKKGFNVVLVSRIESKLVDLASEISGKYKVETKIMSMDFSANKVSDFAALSALIEPLNVTVLINNVGLSHSIPVPFAEVDEKELEDIIVINNIATLKVTRLVTPKLVANKKGLILTMGSFGGNFPTPYLSVYSGSKAFLQYWSSALSSELKPKGVDVELVLSYLVTTAMAKIRRTSLLIPNPKMFVASTLSSIGLNCGAVGRVATSTPYWSHAIYQFIIESTLGTWSKFVMNQNLKMHISIRKRAMKKAEREKKGL